MGIFFLTCAAFVLAGVNTASSQGYWWQAPKLKYAETLDAETRGTLPHYWTFGGPSTTDATLDQTYLYLCYADTNTNFSQYSVAQLRAANNADEVEPRWFTQHIGLPKGLSQFGTRAVMGNGGVQNAPFTAYPDDYTLGSGVEALLTADVMPDCDTLHFNHDGTLLYTNHYVSATGSRSSLHRYRVTGSLSADGTPFTLDTSWKNNGTFTTSVSRLRNLEIKYIAGKDLAYYGEGETGASAVYVLDTSTGQETKLIADAFGDVTDNDVMNVRVGGVAAGDLYLYVMGNIAGLKVYRLAANGLSLAGAQPVASFTITDLNTITGTEAFNSHARAFEVTDDQQYAFFGAHNAVNSLFVVYKDPNANVADWTQR